MTHEREDRLLQLMEEIALTADVERLDELYAPNVVYHQPPYPDANGLDAYKEQLRGTFAGWSDVNISVHEVISGENASMVRWTFEGTHTGETPSSKIPATGKRGAMDICTVIHWDGGKIVEAWDYSDNLGLLRQLGVIPASIAAA